MKERAIGQSGNRAVGTYCRAVGQSGNRAIGTYCRAVGQSGNRAVGKFTIVLLLAVGLAACRQQAPVAEMLQAPAVAGVSESADPALARDPANGDLLLSWVAGDSSGYQLYFARSSDRGATWSAPVRVTDRDHDIKPHAEASPKLVATGNTLALFWPNNIMVPGRRFPASHMRFSRSSDGGKSWTPAITLNDDTTGALAGHTFHGATALGNDTLIVAWLDSRVGAPLSEGDSTVHHEGDATIYTALSPDGGATWEEQNSRRWGKACPCCRVSLATSRNGEVFAAWRGHFDGSVRDPVVARLLPGTAEPKRVRADGWVFHGCPHTGPALAIDDAGTTHVAWFTGKERAAGVFYASEVTGSNTFGQAVPLLTGETLPAAHPALTLTTSGPLIAINLDANGQRALTLSRVRNGKAFSSVVPNTAGADHPHLLAWPDGGALVAWTEQKKDAGAVRLAFVPAAR